MRRTRPCQHWACFKSGRIWGIYSTPLPRHSMHQTRRLLFCDIILVLTCWENTQQNWWRWEAGGIVWRRTKPKIPCANLLRNQSSRAAISGISSHLIQRQLVVPRGASGQLDSGHVAKRVDHVQERQNLTAECCGVFCEQTAENDVKSSTLPCLLTFQLSWQSC